MDIETKSLRLQFSKGKVEQDYNLELDLPDKDQLIHLLELPPHYILSKNEITFSNGILGQMPHAIKLMISRDYQDLYLGLFINIGEKSDQQVQISEVKGIFQSLDNKGKDKATPTTSTPPNGSGGGPMDDGDAAGADGDVDIEGDEDSDDHPFANNMQHVVWNYHHQPVAAGAAAAACAAIPPGVVHQYPLRIHNIGGPSWSNPNNIVNIHPNIANFSPLNVNVNTAYPSYNARQMRLSRKKGMLFSFQKQSPEMRLDDLKQFQHYRSYSHTWPVKRSRVKLTIKVVGIKYSAIVDDEDLNMPDFKSGSSMFNAEQFFMSEYCSDVRLKIGSVVIPGHKIVLSARSEFFNRMFSNPMRETVEGVVELGDDEAHFTELIRFIYLGKVENLGENVSELYVLADKYQIEDLGTYCEKYLLSKLAVENVMEMFDLSHSVGRQGLLAKRSKELIMWNKEKFAPDLDTFKEFFNKYPELIFEILKL